MEGFVGFYALLLIPGFIWVQVYEHYLLREKKEQFVKSLEIVLWSALIWAISLCLPFTGSVIIKRYLKGSASGKNVLPDLALQIDDLLIFFAVVCLGTFVAANVWAYMRRVKWWNDLVMALTGRDWYPTAAQKFYAENMERGVLVIMKEKRYIGTLCSAPDTASDGHIMLRNPAVAIKPDERPVLMTASTSLLLKVADIVEIMSLESPSSPRPTPPNPPTLT